MVGVSLAGWELTRTGGEGTIREPAHTTAVDQARWHEDLEFGRGEQVACRPSSRRQPHSLPEHLLQWQVVGACYTLTGSDGSACLEYARPQKRQVTVPVGQQVGFSMLALVPASSITVSANHGSRLLVLHGRSIDLIPVLGQEIVYVVGTELAALRLGDGKRAWGFPR